jgi:hypothetical protein
MGLSDAAFSGRKIGPETLRQQRPALTTTRKDRVMAKRQLPDAEHLRKLLDYDPQTGVLSWRHRPEEMFISPAKAAWWNRTFAGKPAMCCLHPVGYWHGTIEQKAYYAHRIIWKLVYGADPAVIDHINGDKTDNRLANLRSVGRAENNRNRSLSRGNSSGVSGVRFEANRWVARIGKTGGYLGRFETKDEAIAARKAAEAENNFHPNHGRTQ